MVYDLNKFKTGTEKLVTFDFLDFASGKSIKVLECGDTKSSHVITDATFFGHDGFSRVREATQDIDFDTTFQLPITIEGSTLITFSGFHQRISGGSSATSTTFGAELKHVRDTTEFSLGSDTFELSSTLIDGQAQGKLITFDIDVPNKHFAIGDILRLTITATEPSDAGKVTDTEIYHDPKNRTFTTGSSGDTTTTSSQMSIQLPVVTE